ncbi:hypothetical protein RsTz2092_11840 [Deferribacterales bacterium RsTz2092]|nr:hypothetical protein AGMMS49941_09690 [Deferribacterales bacterium]
MVRRFDALAILACAFIYMLGAGFAFAGPAVCNFIEYSKSDGECKLVDVATKATFSAKCTAGDAAVLAAGQVNACVDFYDKREHREIRALCGGTRKEPTLVYGYFFPRRNTDNKDDCTFALGASTLRLACTPAQKTLLKQAAGSNDRLLAIRYFDYGAVAEGELRFYSAVTVARVLPKDSVPYSLVGHYVDDDNKQCTFRNEDEFGDTPDKVVLDCSLEDKAALRLPKFSEQLLVVNFFVQDSEDGKHNQLILFELAK